MPRIAFLEKLRSDDSFFEKELEAHLSRLRRTIGLNVTYRKDDMVLARRKFNRDFSRLPEPREARSDEAELFFYLSQFTATLFSAAVSVMTPEDAIVDDPDRVLSEAQTQLIRTHWNSYVLADFCLAVFIRQYATYFALSPLITDAAKKQDALLELCRQTDAAPETAGRNFLAFIDALFPVSAP